MLFQPTVFVLETPGRPFGKPKTDAKRRKSVVSLVNKIINQVQPRYCHAKKTSGVERHATRRRPISHVNNYRTAVRGRINTRVYSRTVYTSFPVTRGTEHPRWLAPVTPGGSRVMFSLSRHFTKPSVRVTWPNLTVCVCVLRSAYTNRPGETFRFQVTGTRTTLIVYGNGLEVVPRLYSGKT